MESSRSTAPMSEGTILKTFRLKQETFEALARLAESENRPLDALIAEALEDWLDAKAKALMEAQIEREKRETTFDYDEFWDGVELD